MSNNTDLNSIFDLGLVKQYANERISIGVAIFLGYFFHYVAHASVYIGRNGKANELKEIEKNMFLFGIAGILSCNVFQSGVYQAVLAYFTFICLLLVHLPVFSANFDLKKYFWLAFYFMLWIWYFGIIVDYYDFYSNLSI